LEEFNGDGSKVEKRQLFDDIKFMESEAGFPIPLERIRIQLRKIAFWTIGKRGGKKIFEELN
jgi:hypothetical protein